MNQTQVLLDLFSDDYAWRNKVLKVIQYASKLCLWYLLRKEGDTSKRISQLRDISKNLSFARAMFTAGTSVGAVRDLFRSNSTSKAFLTLTDAATNVLDDMSTLNRAGIFRDDQLPPHFGVMLEWSCALSTLIHLPEAYNLINKTETELTAAVAGYHNCRRRMRYGATAEWRQGSDTSSSKNTMAEQDHNWADQSCHDHPNEVVATATALRQVQIARYRYVCAWLGFLKLLCDMGQTLPPVLHVKTPEVLDTSCGLFAATLAVVKSWIERQYCL